MSSYFGVANVEQGNAFFVNIATLSAGDFLAADGTGLSLEPVLNALALGSPTIGTVTVRDMGKTIRLGTGATQKTLRLVQRVDSAAAGTNNDGVGGVSTATGSNGYETFYINLYPTIPSSTVKWVRLSL
jgi:hypothetical protein